MYIEKGLLRYDCLTDAKDNPRTRMQIKSTQPTLLHIARASSFETTDEGILKSPASTHISKSEAHQARTNWSLHEHSLTDSELILIFLYLDLPSYQSKPFHSSTLFPIYTNIILRERVQPLRIGYTDDIHIKSIRPFIHNWISIESSFPPNHSLPCIVLLMDLSSIHPLCYTAITHFKNPLAAERTVTFNIYEFLVGRLV